MICKDFLHLCDCLVLHYFLEACSTYSSIKKVLPVLGRTFLTYSLREGGFLSVIYKDFLHLCDCLVLHYFLEACSTYSSVIERKREERLIIKVGLFKVCLLSCQFSNL